MKKLCGFRWCRSLLVVVVFALAGCGSVRYPKIYVLDLQQATRRAVSPQGSLGALLVREFQCPDYVCDGRIVYRPAPHEVGFYEYHRWAVSPRQMITDGIARGAQATGLFTTVSVRGRNADAAFLLTGQVERLEEVDQAGDVHAVCVLSAELAEVRTTRIIWSRSETATVPVVERNMTGVVASLSEASRMAVDALLRSMQERVQSVRSAP